MRSGFIICICLMLTACLGLKPEAQHLIIPNADPDHITLHAISGNWWVIFKNNQLNELIAVALTDSPSMQQAESRFRRAKFLAAEMGTTLWPTLDSYLSLSRERLTQNTFFPPPYGGNSYTESNLGLNFNYEFDFWGKNRSALASRIDEARATAAEAAEARLVLAAAISSSYYQLVYSYGQLTVAKKILHAEKSLLTIIKDRAKHGVESDIPVTNANTDLQISQINVTRLQEQTKLLQNQLAVLVGKNPFTLCIKPIPYHLNNNFLRIPKYIPADLIARRPDLQAASLRAQAAAAEVNVAKAQFFPNINLMALFSFQSFTLSKIVNLGSRDYSYGTAINLPIFDAGLRRANLGAKYSEYDLAVQNYNNTLLESLHQAADQIATLQSAKAQLLAEQQAANAAKKNFSLIRSRYHHGIVDYINVLNAQSNYLQEQNKLLQLQAQHLNATVALIKALGGNYLTGA